MLVFARTATAEAAAKPGVAADAPALACALLRSRAVRTARASGLPVVEWDERRQRGASLGERLAHAVASVFAEGYRYVVVIGGDCPELRPAHLLRAARHVEGGRTAVGRDRRGGAYLVTADAEGFDPERFAALPWASGHLAAALLDAYCPEGGTDGGLPVLRDVNRDADLRSVADRLRGQRGWSRWLRREGPRQPVGRRVTRRAAPELTTGSGRRGPPVAA